MMRYRLFVLMVTVFLALLLLASCSASGFMTSVTTGTDGSTETVPPPETGDIPDGKGERVTIGLPEEGKTPVKASWTHYGCFGCDAYETEDGELIGELMIALRGLFVSDEQGPDITTDDTVIILYMEDGEEYRICFNGSSFQINDGKNYPYSLYVVKEGWGELNCVLDKFVPPESE